MGQGFLPAGAPLRVGRMGVPGDDQHGVPRRDRQGVRAIGRRTETASGWGAAALSLSAGEGRVDFDLVSLNSTTLRRFQISREDCSPTRSGRSQGAWRGRRDTRNLMKPRKMCLWGRSRSRWSFLLDAFVILEETAVSGGSHDRMSVRMSRLDLFRVCRMFSVCSSVVFRLPHFRTVECDDRRRPAG
jgi:hypothetical protein